jgi:hypothetical protein
MRKLQKLPLFDHTERVRVRALPLPVRRLVRRYGLKPATALEIACAAGFRCGDDR